MRSPIGLHRERLGAGVPIVLSHGLGDDGSTWSALALALAPHNTVVTWDLRGHRYSDRPVSPEEYTGELAIADLLGVIDDGGEPVHLVGHSLGGYLSLALALRRPDLVLSLTMISSGPGYRDPAARAKWNSYVDDVVLRMPVPPAAAGLARQSDSTVIDALPSLQPPLLVLVGERDTRFHDGAAYLARIVPGSRLQHIAGAGHHPQQTDADSVAASVTEFTQR